ncbi:MAG: autotransporter domain-containing protein, partial [Phycisphaerae bacterium]
MKLCKKTSQFHKGKSNILLICHILIMALLTVQSYAGLVYIDTESSTWLGTPTISTIDLPLASTTKDATVSPVYMIGQSFTVGLDDPLVLDKIAIMGDGGQTYTNIRLVDITDLVVGGVTPTSYPAGEDLLPNITSLTITATLDSVREFDFTDDDEIVLQAGHTYVFELVSNNASSGFWWHRLNFGGSVYDGGDFYVALNGPNNDRQFRWGEDWRRDLAMAVYLIGGFNWSGNANNSWNNPDNWRGHTVPEDSIGEILTFGNRDDGDRVLTDVDGAYTDIPTISFSGARGNYTITGTGSFDIDSGGIVGLGDGGHTHTLNIEFVSNAGDGIVFNGSDNIVLEGIVSGDGGITKQGSAYLQLNGINTYTGDTTLTAGRLILNGEIASNVTVNGGTFMGTGLVSGHNLTVNSGGSVAPGNSIGTLTIDGDFTLSNGAIFDAEVLKVGAVLDSDLLDVSGTATLELGSTIRVINLSAPKTITDGDTFTIITAGTIDDDGVSVIHNSVILSFTGEVVGNDYILTADAKDVYSENNFALLSAVNEDYLTATGDFANLIAILDALGDAAVNSAAEALSPSMHGSVRDFNIRMAQNLTGDLTSYLGARRRGTEYMARFDVLRQSDLLLADASGNPDLLTQVVGETERLRQRHEDASREIHTFFRPFGVWSSQSSGKEFTGYTGQSFGTHFGFDKIFRDNWILGLGGSYTHSCLNFDKGAGEAQIDSFRIGPYASYFQDRWYVDGSVTIGYHINKTERDILLPGIDRTAKAKYDAWDVSAYVGTGYDLDFWKWTLTPSASIQYTRYRNQSFVETGAQDIGMDVEATTQQSLLSRLGLRLYTVTTLYDFKLAPELFVGYSYEFMGQENIRSRFVGGT